MMIACFWILATLAATGDGRGAQVNAGLPNANRPMEERFAAPPGESRILMIQHMLPVEQGPQDEFLQSLLARGFGGMVTNNRFTDYLQSEENWQGLIRGVESAKKLGMALWLYDERGYPSGNAGGITMREHPEWEARGLFVTQGQSSGGAVEIECPPGRLIRAAAFPLADGQLKMDAALDLAGQVHDGKLTWEAPAGSWQVMAITEDRLYEGTHAAVSLADKLPYINLLMIEPTARFLEVTHDAYAARFGNDLGKWFIATFTDEPSLMSLFMRPQPWSVLPWAPNLPVEFEKRRGYALEPVIPQLVSGSGPTVGRARYDFWWTVGELVSENFFGQIQKWCRNHNTLSGGHLLMEEAILTHVPLYGDFFRCIRRLDAPSMDCLTSIPSEVPWYVARLISSAAELEGRDVTMSETSDHCQRYRPQGDTRPVYKVSEEEIRGTCNRQIVNGITTITSYYSFDGLSNEQLVRLNEWIGRCCTMLKGGRQVADIAVVYPAETMWTRFAPGRNWVNDSPASARQVQATYEDVSRALYRQGRDFTYIDSRAIVEASIKDGALCVGPHSWRLVVLPCIDTLPMKAWENLASLWRSGGSIVAINALPANSETEFPSPAVQAIAQEVFGAARAGEVVSNEAGGLAVFLGVGTQALFGHVVDSVLEKDIVIPDGSPLHGTHRRIDGHEVFFVINDSAEAWSGSISLGAVGAGEQWDPATGQISPLASPESIALNLQPYGGMLFRFAEAKPALRKPTAGGSLPVLLTTKLPEVSPGVGKGEFVQADVKQVSQAGQKQWSAAATLAKSDVDTFLFLMFTYPNPVDLSQAAYLAFDVSIPEGQRAGASLLVILRDEDGIEYYANTHVPLSDTTSVRAYAAKNRFERAGWSKTPEGQLDFAKIREIRIGWGGYFGKEGETVAFTTGAPEAIWTEK